MITFKYNIIKLTMKLYNKDIPDTNEVVFVKIIDYDDNYGTINVSINEYDDLGLLKLFQLSSGL